MSHNKVLTLKDGEYRKIQEYSICTVIYGDEDGYFILQDTDGNRDGFDESDIEFLN